jgi:hypothetical protein
MENLGTKRMLFLETVSDDIGQNRFTIIAGIRREVPHDIQPIIEFTEILHLWDWNWVGRNHKWNWKIVRKNPFSLKVLAVVQLWVQSGDSTITKDDQRRSQKISRSQ